MQPERLSLRRRDLLIGAAACLAEPARADPAAPFRFSQWPPLAPREAWLAWMSVNRGEDPAFLEKRYERYLDMLSFNDLYTPAEKRAFLMTPREEFVLPDKRADAYAPHLLDIGFGVSITPPGTAGRMTSALGVRAGDKVLEIGTGSGFQSAMLAYLTDRLWTVEIIPELGARARRIYNGLIDRGYGEFSAIQTASADGCYGWEDAAPFDKIIVTCGIDHIPPPLLLQLRVGGIMVIPVGPPGAQHILKVVKTADGDGAMNVARSDIFGGRIIPFVPLAGGHQGEGG